MTNSMFSRCAGASDDEGFTLIELLVVVAIIAILAAVAIPVFTTYRARSYDAKSRTDLANAALGEEAYYGNTNRYVDCYGTAHCQTLLPGFRGSKGTVISMYDLPASNGAPEGFTGSAYNLLGLRNNSQYACYWNSNSGGMQ